MVKILEVMAAPSVLGNAEVDFDPGKDILVYMQNDPMFYRKHLYPVLIDYEESKKNKQSFNTKSLLPVVDAAIPLYCKKFNIMQDPRKLFTKAIKLQIIRDILSPPEDMTRGIDDQNMR